MNSGLSVSTSSSQKEEKVSVKEVLYLTQGLAQGSAVEHELDLWENTCSYLTL